MERFSTKKIETEQEDLLSKAHELILDFNILVGEVTDEEVSRIDEYLTSEFHIISHKINKEEKRKLIAVSKFTREQMQLIIKLDKVFSAKLNYDPNAREPYLPGIHNMHGLLKFVKNYQSQLF